MTTKHTPATALPDKQRDLYRILPRVHIFKADQRDGRIEKAFRLYCTMHGQAWELQVRGPMGIGNLGMHQGKDDIIASASLSVDDMRALRDQISAILRELGEL